jgi:hypothetical protein
LGRSDAWGELTFQALTPPWDPALELFRFVGAWAPPARQIEWAWGFEDDERLRGALVAERSGTNAMLHGPVVVAPADTSPDAAIEVAGELLTRWLRHVETAGVDTVFARPQGLDRIWVRHGFIPMPEAELPKPLRGRPGTGLFGWRGGTALWSSAGRGNSRGRAQARS